MTAMYEMANLKNLAPLGAAACGEMAAFQALDRAGLAAFVAVALRVGAAFTHASQLISG